jgi:hypothetical protein
MADLQPIHELINLAICERDAILKALRDDRRSADIQQAIADWNAGRTDGIFPPGATTKLLNTLRPKRGYGRFQTAFQEANGAVIHSTVGSNLLPMLKAAYDAHIALLDEARSAYESSSTRLMTREQHGRALTELIDITSSASKTADEQLTLENKHVERALWLATAMLLVQEHPDWSDARIAREVGKHPSTLSRDKTYQAAATMARGDKSDRRRGHVTVDPDSGQQDVEAYSDDPEEQDLDE